VPEVILRFAKIRGALGYHAVRAVHRPASQRGCLTYVGAFGLRSVAALT